MTFEIEDYVSWKAPKYADRIIRSGCKKSNPISSQVDSEEELLNVCCYICFGDGIPIGSIWETPDNSISLQSYEKPWMYESIMKELSKNLNTYEISELTSVTEKTIRGKAKEFNLSGRGRVSWEIENSWEKAKQHCRERDKRCVVCGLTNNEHKTKFGRGLDVHHIIPRKVFDEKRNADSLRNLVCLCEDCHGTYEASPRELFIEAYVR